MPTVSVIMPVYNVEQFVGAAIESVLRQTYPDFELIIVNDRSPDGSLAICESFNDSRIHIVTNRVNRGLAGARNTGIRYAGGRFLAFLDSDDLWAPYKLEKHVRHLLANPGVGISFSRSAFIHADGADAGCYQMPRLRDIEPGYYLCRNPIGNGSAPVIRREVFEEIGYPDSLHHPDETFWFDERFRQSEDIECWVRIALTTEWVIEGLPEPLTCYRLNAGGLSANLHRQYESWERMIEKTRQYAPDFIARWEDMARAFQLRYLARQAIRLGDGTAATEFMLRALRAQPGIALREPGRTLVTAGAALLLRVLPQAVYRALEQFAVTCIGGLQRARIGRESKRRAAGAGNSHSAVDLRPGSQFASEAAGGRS